MPTEAQISELLNGAADFLDGRKLTSHAWLRKDDDSQVDIIPLDHSADLPADLKQVAKACTMGAIKVRLMLAPPDPQTGGGYRHEIEDAAAQTMMLNPPQEVEATAAQCSGKFPPNHSRQAMLWTSDKIVEQYGEVEASRIIVKWLRHSASA